MKVMALDPGGTTGYAVQDGPDTAFGQAPPESVWVTLETYDPDVVVCERFGRPTMRATDLTAVEVIGVVKEWCRQRERPLHLQTPEQAKHLWGNDRLRGLGLYQRGLPHANDAVRHLLYWRHFNPKGPRAEIPDTVHHPALESVSEAEDGREHHGPISGR